MAYLDSVSVHQRELASTSLQESPWRCSNAYPIPFFLDASTCMVVSRAGSKWTNTGGETRAAFTASNARSWSAFHVYELRVLSKGRRGALAAATSVENPASCSTRPINDRSSEILVGRGNCDSALNLPSSIVTPPRWMSDTSDTGGLQDRADPGDMCGERTVETYGRKGRIRPPIIFIAGTAEAHGGPQELVAPPWRHKCCEMLAGRVEGDLVVTIYGVKTGEEAAFAVNFSHRIAWRASRVRRPLDELVQTRVVDADPKFSAWTADHYQRCGPLRRFTDGYDHLLLYKIIQLALHFCTVAKRDRPRAVYVKGYGVVTQLDNHVRPDHLAQTIFLVEH
ncbi:hypothetical protein OUZ56_033253 [Daphnia magna]|uniref:Uncharacterized protein n=1 Tax=Daphnia magna TaxID=35525 RepID=A0ABQ9ZXT9_9CRUS|nr:hypothetical protein OUZ56_033253 [Daphnia magna]